MKTRMTRRRLLKSATGIGGLALVSSAGLIPGRLLATTRKPRIGPWGFDLAGMDLDVAPGDDFFHYAGGTWMKQTPIPSDRSRWGAFDILREKSELDVRDAIETAARGPLPKGSVPRKVVDCYQSYIDVDTIDGLGMKPAAKDIARVLSARSHEDIARFANGPDVRVASPIRIDVTLDARRPDKYVMGVRQSGLGMPDRQYYLRHDARFATTREKYRSYIETVLAIAGYPEPATSAQAVYDLEHRIAQLQWSRAKSRNRDLTYNPKSHKELEVFAPQFPWAAALESFGAPGEDFFVVAQTDAIQGLAKLFSATPVATWRAYTIFHYLSEMSDLLPRQLDEAHFDFYGRVITGQLEQRDRWRRAVHAMNVMPIRQAVGQLYVKRHFTPAEKTAALGLVENLRHAYRRRITALPWMTQKTKQAALAKLARMTVKIGYPDRWLDYSSLDIEEGDAFGNRKRQFGFERQRDIKRLSKPADRSEWGMAPQTVNAYNKPTWNEIVFPAAILQSPFFDFAADDAVNYGGIGAVIGHEMGHAFDDQGSKTDANGVLRNWWSAEDRKRFNALTEKLVEQYSKFEVLPGLYINGRMTLGENIGDLGGLNASLEAYRISQGDTTPPKLNGFSGVQRFFLGFSQIWRTNTREEALRNQLVSDVHSPAEYRTNGTVRNVDEWYAAFGVTSHQKLYLPPGQRVRIW